MLEPLVEAESLLTLVTIFAGGFLPPLLLSILVLQAASKDAAEIVVFSSLAIAASAGAIWVARMARAAMNDPCPRLAAMLGASRRLVPRATPVACRPRPWLS